MMGRTHALSGAAGWLAAAPMVAEATGHPLGPGVLAASTAVAAGAALLPDLDHEHGLLAHSLGPVTRLLTQLVARGSGGHRHATHSLAFGVALGALMSAALANRWAMLTIAGVCTARSAVLSGRPSTSRLPSRPAVSTCDLSTRSREGGADGAHQVPPQPATAPAGLPAQGGLRLQTGRGGGAAAALGPAGDRSQRLPLR